MHQLIDKKKRILVYLIFFIILSTISNKSIQSQKISFSKTNKIKVTGLSDRNNFKITRELKQSLIKNVFFIEKGSIDKILSQYNIIETFSVKKIYPSEIQISIKQTNFIARISRDKDLLVGENGKLIENENTNKVLPFIYGEFETDKFLKFKKYIDNSKFEFSNFKSILFYRYNRWDILTVDNILIKLPDTDLPKALNLAYNIKSNEQFKDISVIDLRIANQIITQ